MKYIVGIDPGTHTGIAIYNVAHDELQLKTIHELYSALELINTLTRVHIGRILIKIENPKLWRRFSKVKNAAARMQGAGSVKRDFSIWKQFFIEKEIPFEEFPPDKVRNGMAKNPNIFSQITGFTGQSSEHARCAAMLLYFGNNRLKEKTGSKTHWKKGGRKSA